jgi:hypothetical protein
MPGIGEDLLLPGKRRHHGYGMDMDMDMDMDKGARPSNPAAGLP